MLLEPGMGIQVGPLADSNEYEQMQQVSSRVTEAGALDEAWKGEVHAMQIQGLSKTLIRGYVGGVKCVIDRSEYADFLNQFPGHDAVQDHGALALGDWICGVFVSELGPERRVRLGFKDALAEAENDCEKAAASTAWQEEELRGRLEYKPVPPVSWINSPPEAISPLLFVEDDELCRHAWADILADVNVDVDSFADYESALQCIERGSVDYRMAIIDVHLVGADDQFGLRLAQILRQQPQCRVVLASAQDSLRGMWEKWGGLPIYGYIEKPVLTEDWGAVIDAAATMPEPRPLREWLSGVEMRESGGESTESYLSRSPESNVGHVLAAFCSEVPGAVAHVFRLHPRSWRGRSLASAGGRLNWEVYRGKLGMSIIKDAACSAEALVDNECPEDWQHFWTKQMTDYRSFWGQALPVPGSYRHVLVVFHPAQEAFTKKLQMRAACCAQEVARLLACEQLRNRAEHDSEQSSAGLGYACLAHEIYATLTGVQMAVTRMRTLLGTAKQVDSVDVERIRRTVSDLAAHVPDLVTNARILRGSAGGSKAISVLFCLEKSVMGIEEAKKTLLKRPDNILVELVQANEEEDWNVEVNAAALVTVFFNVLLNAIQQIELFSDVRRKGWVGAQLRRYQDEASAPWAVIWIKDSGPGIHPEDWESVFEPGYSTKHHGTGLGLHICRQLLGDIWQGNRKASIQITRSVLWAGTTVTIRLPLPESTKERADSRWPR